MSNERIFFCRPDRGAHHRLVISSISLEAKLSVSLWLYLSQKAQFTSSRMRSKLLKSLGLKTYLPESGELRGQYFSFESHRSFGSTPIQLICGRERKERKKNAAQHLLFLTLLITHGSTSTSTLKPLIYNISPLVSTFRRFFSIYLERELNSNRSYSWFRLVFPPHSSTTPCSVVMMAYPKATSFKLLAKAC